MFDKIAEFLLNLVVYIATVAVVFTSTAWIVMLVAKPLITFSFIQSLSAVVLAFIFFFIGKIDFDVDDEEEYY